MKKEYISADGNIATVEEHAEGTATLHMFAGRVYTRCTYHSLSGARAAMARVGHDWKEITNE